MNITENRPMPNDPRADATEPTTEVTDEMSKAFFIHPSTASWILKSRPRVGILSSSQTFTFSNHTVISDALKEVDWRLPLMFVMMLEKTGKIWVTTPRNMISIRSSETMADSQSGALLPFILRCFRPFIMGLPRRETTAARII